MPLFKGIFKRLSGENDSSFFLSEIPVSEPHLNLHQEHILFLFIFFCKPAKDIVNYLLVSEDQVIRDMDVDSFVSIKDTM